MFRSKRDLIIERKEKIKENTGILGKQATRPKKYNE